MSAQTARRRLYTGAEAIMRDRLNREIHKGQKILYVKSSQLQSADPLVLGEVIGDNLVKMVVDGSSDKINVRPLDSSPKGKILRDIWISNPRHVVIVEDIPCTQSTE